MDLSDIRRVYQYLVPSSLSVHKQRYGRAGRDGLPAYAVLIVEPSVFQIRKAKKKKPKKQKKQTAGAQPTVADNADNILPGNDSEDENGFSNNEEDDEALGEIQSEALVDDEGNLVYRKKVEAGLREWLEAPQNACRREIANRYFANPVNSATSMFFLPPAMRAEIKIDSISSYRTLLRQLRATRCGGWARANYCREGPSLFFGPNFDPTKRLGPAKSHSKCISRGRSAGKTFLSHIQVVLYILDVISRTRAVFRKYRQPSMMRTTRMRWR